MMTPEERKRFKEAEKSHLRKLKALRAAARRQQASAGLSARFATMMDDFRKSSETHDEFISKLDEDTALSEARLEVALEAQPEVQNEMSDSQKAAAVLAEMHTALDREAAAEQQETARGTAKTIGRMPEAAHRKKSCGQ